MTQNKRFALDKDGVTLIDNFDDSLCECKYSYEAKVFVDKFNELNDENIGLKQIIREAYATERTKLCKSVLRQLLNQIKEV